MRNFIALCLLLAACGPTSSTGTTGASGGTGALDVGFLNGTWVSACEDAGAGTFVIFCATFSGTNTLVSKNGIYSNATCTAWTTTTTTTATYALDGAATTPAGATNCNFTNAAIGQVFYSILQRDNDDLNFGTMSGAYDGSTPALRHRTFYVTAFSKTTCPF